MSLTVTTLVRTTVPILAVIVYCPLFANRTEATVSVLVTFKTVAAAGEILQFTELPAGAPAKVNKTGSPFSIPVVFEAVSTSGLIGFGVSFLHEENAINKQVMAINNELFFIKQSLVVN